MSISSPDLPVGRPATFDRVAEAYDRYRPGYPEALVEYIITASHIPPGGKILEVGSGTGKATLPFARRGYSIHCIDTGKNLIDVARRNLAAYPKVTFENANFNTWEPGEEIYDLVMSAQAWHWMDVTISYQKAARALKPAGALALFWNKTLVPDTVASQAIQRVYEQVVPGDLQGGAIFSEQEISELQSEIEQSGYFQDLSIWRYPWSQHYNAEEYLGLLSTFSDHVLLPEETRQKLYAGIGQAIHDHGGFIDRPVVAIVFLARKSNNLRSASQG